VTVSSRSFCSTAAPVPLKSKRVAISFEIAQRHSLLRSYRLPKLHQTTA
jgi:hypothetical protein